MKSIKYNASRDYSTQDRAVTADDYKVLVKSLYANVNQFKFMVVKTLPHLTMVKFIFQLEQNQVLI